MVHTFEEIRTRTTANPNEAAPEAAMPQAAWEALLRDKVQVLRPPKPPNPPPVAPDQSPPGVGHRCPTGPHNPPHRHHLGEGKGTGKGRARDGRGHLARGQGRAQGDK